MKILVFSAVAVLVLGGLFANSSVTGSFVNGESVKLSLHDHVLRFFQVADVSFPLNSACAATAREIYQDIALSSLDRIDGFSTSGVERLSTQNFVIDRINRYGTVDFVKSPTFVNGADGLISISSEAVVSVPKASRNTFVVIDLYGRNSGGAYPLFSVNRGRFSTPSVDCIFVVQGGRTICECDVHTIQGIAIGGVTSPPKVQDSYDLLVEKYRNEFGSGEFNGFVVE